MLAQQSYHDAPAGEPAAASLNGETVRYGRVLEGRALTLALPGSVEPSDLVVVFRGSDDVASWLTAIRDIDGAYAPVAGLVRAMEAHAAAGGRVVLVGHSLGGAIVQLFMYAHPGDPRYVAVTFGSPGAMPKRGLFGRRVDPRITNYVVEDDPFVFLGEHRAEVRGYASRHPFRALLLAIGVARASGASVLRVLVAARDMRVDYLNNGRRVVLPGGSAPLTLARLARANPDEHEVETYVARTAPQPFPAPACISAAAR